MSRSKLDANPLPVDFMVALYDFQGRAKDEFTIKAGQTLYLVEDNRSTDEWALVRAGVDPSTPSGLVPWTYIKSKEPLYRASALYSFARQMTNEIEMKMGQTMSVYGGAGVKLLVKLDDFNGQVGRVGLVPQNYVEEFRAGEKEELVPISSKDLPERYCSVCEGSFENSVRYECTQCLLPNGNKYFICLRCHSDPKVPTHQHPLITISPESLISQSHANALVARPPSYQRYLCDGCRREISRYVLDCKRCPAPGYDLCLECAETDRATYWHDRWTGGAPHEFEVVDLRLFTT